MRLSGPAHFGADTSLTGAEIAAWVNEALIRAFDRPADLMMDDFQMVAQQTVPLAQMRQDEIRAMREWAFGHAVPATAPAFASDDGDLSEVCASIPEANEPSVSR